MIKSRLYAAAKRSPWLHAQVLRLRDEVGKSLQEPEFDLLPAMCEATGTAIDIGANVGHLTKILLQCVSNVIAVEPIPRLTRVLELRFAKALADRRLILEPCAFSEQEGTIDLFVPHDAAGLATVEANEVRNDARAGKVISVPCRRLDNLSNEHVKFIKIDVEGHECAVVAGGLSLIARDRPTMLIEAEDRHRKGTISRLCALLSPLGYEGYFLLNGMLNPVANFDVQRYQNRAALDTDGKARHSGAIYINNFLFFPSRSPQLSRVLSQLHP